MSIATFLHLGSSISITTRLSRLPHRRSSVFIATILHRRSSMSITTLFRTEGSCGKSEHGIPPATQPRVASWGSSNHGDAPRT